MRWAISILAVLTTNAVAHPGWGIVVDRQQNIYFGDVVENRIWKITPEGRRVQLAVGKHSHVLFRDENDTVYGEHVYYIPQGERWVTTHWKITPGRSVADIQQPPPGYGKVVDLEGNQYSIQGAAESTVLVRTAPGGQTTILGGRPFGGLPRGEHPRLLGLAVDGRRHVFVADFDFRCIREVSPDGRMTTVLSSGLFWSPSGVVFHDGRMYVLEHYPESFPGILTVFIGPYARVRVVDPAGRVRTLTVLWGWKMPSVAAAFLLTLAIVAPVLRRLLGRVQTKRGSSLGPCRLP